MRTSPGRSAASRWCAAHEGWSVFVDCDFLFTGDVCKVPAGLDQSKAIYVVQHDYTPALSVKMDGELQHVYPRKNWSSFILFNGGHPAVKALVPAFVNTAEPSILHRFAWVKDEDIGSLDLTWNFLVGEYPKPHAIPISIHYTNGGPWFEDYVDVGYGDLWTAERALYLATS